jgi:MFS family permease
MSTSAAATLPGPVPLKRDAGVIGLVGVAHMVSHFGQLLLPPLFPWLTGAMGASYTQLAFLMTIFFVVSCGVQTASGFLVDRFGPRPVLFGGLLLVAAGAFGFAASPNYAAMALFAVVGGTGNGVFHPANYTLLNRKVSARRLGHAYSVHGVTGSLGWAVAPLLVVPLAIAFHWRVALAAGGAVALVLMRPFVVNNAREYDDPMWHTDIHATFYANLEDTKGEVLLEPLLRPDERIRPEIVVPMYRAPLVSWADFVTDVIGPAEFARREAKAAIVLPVDALRLGWLPWPVGALAFAAAIVAALRRRDRAVVVLAGLSAATVAGYGMILPYFDRRLVSHLTPLLVLLVCAGLAEGRRGDEPVPVDDDAAQRRTSSSS